MPEEPDRQSFLDEEHLRLVALGYMISAGFAFLFAFFGIFYSVIGIVTSVSLAHAPASSRTGLPSPVFAGWIFAGVGLFIFISAISVAILRFFAARYIKQRKSRTFCMVIAGLSCLEFPYGTAIGVLTLIVLGRKSVVRLFDSKPAQ
jgi:hypothetical protein